MSKKFGKSAYRIALLSNAAVMGVFFATSAQAQADSSADKGKDGPPVLAAESPGTATSGDIVVTGSRIRTPNLTSEAPLQSVDDKDLARSGQGLVSQALSNLPQFGTAFSNQSQGQGNANTGFGLGVELVNLRNLGPQRTLVLVNGRRHIGGDPGTSSVDLNAIPTSMVERVDVVTGAASAIYGADAVSGVVNVILKDHFEGLEVSATAGITSRGDDAEQRANIIVGGKFLNERGHVLLGAEYYNSEGFYAINRAYGQGAAQNGIIDLTDGSSGIPGGRIIGGANGQYIFNSSNQLVPYATAPDEEKYYQSIRQQTQSSPNRRYLTSINLSYDLVDAGPVTVTGYVESTYANARTRVQTEPQVLFFQGAARYGTPNESPADQILIPANNPFLLPLIPTIGAVPAAGVEVRRRFSETGPRSIIVDRDTFRFTGGLRGNLGPNFTYDAYYQYGNVKAKQTDTGVFDRSRVTAALNVNDNGTPGNLADDTCADARYRQLGCVPLNVFGVGSVSNAFLNYAIIPSVSNTNTKQDVLSGYISGKIFDLPAGPVSIVGGLEYRRESLVVQPAASYLDHTSSVRFLDAASGSYHVFEQFGELRLPLLADIPFIKALTVSGAVRFSKYSTIGSTTSWNVRGDWEVSPSLRFRGTTGTAVRAPNINELYAPTSRTNSATFDPCDTIDDRGNAITNIAPNIVANCRTVLGARYTGFDQTQPQRGTLVSINSGNPNLGAEKARTYTVGAVLTPKGFARGLSLSVDYYRIKINNVISSLSIQDTVAQCYSQPNLPSVYCSRVQRDPTTGQLLGVQNQLFNAANETVEGLDAQFLYGMTPGFIPGRIDLRAIYAHLFKHDFVARDGADVDVRAGQVGDSKDRLQLGAIYTLNKISFSWDARYISGALADSQHPADEAGNRLPAVWTHDVQVRFAVNDRFGLTLGATNLFDAQPPLVGDPWRTITDTNVYGGVYDTRGRFFYATATAKF